MRILFIAVNGVAGVLLLLLVVSLAVATDYSAVVITSPVFFGDVLVLLCASVGPITIGSVALANYPKAILPVVLFAVAAVTGVLAYSNLPTVRREALLTRYSKAKAAAEGLEAGRDFYSTEPDYYRRILKEAQMFRAIYESQCEFLFLTTTGENAARNNLNAYRVPLFFGVFSVAALFNCLCRRAPQQLTKA